LSTARPRNFLQLQPLPENLRDSAAAARLARQAAGSRPRDGSAVFKKN
jgi:hypothetical protein